MSRSSAQWEEFLGRNGRRAEGIGRRFKLPIGSGEELLQTALERLVKVEQRGSCVENVDGWLFQVMRNEAFRVMRRERLDREAHNTINGASKDSMKVELGKRRDVDDEDPVEIAKIALEERSRQQRAWLDAIAAEMHPGRSWDPFVVLLLREREIVYRSLMKVNGTLSEPWDAGGLSRWIEQLVPLREQEVTRPVVPGCGSPLGLLMAWEIVRGVLDREGADASGWRIAEALSPALPDGLTLAQWQQWHARARRKAIGASEALGMELPPMTGRQRRPSEEEG